MPMANAVLLRLAPLPPHPSPLAHSSPKLALLLPLGRYRGRTAGVIRATSDVLTKPNPATSSTMSLATTVVLWLAPLPPHRSPLAPSSPKPALLLPLGRYRGCAAGVIRAAGDGLADQTTVYTSVYGPWTVEDSDGAWEEEKGGWWLGRQSSAAERGRRRLNGIGEEVTRGLGRSRDVRRLARRRLGFLTWVGPFIRRGENERTARIR